MRPTKSRSRSKNSSNRNRSVGNVVNRVFDSSGPEGKVRGTPQQIIEKYTQLARDAHLSNDRVAFENFQQHSEHYTRMLSEAMREMEAKREQQEREHRDRQQSRDDQQGNRPDQQSNRSDQQGNRPDQQSNRPEHQHQQDRQEQRQPDREVQQKQQPDPSMSDQPDVIDTQPIVQEDSGLVETPEEAQPKRKPRARKPKAAPVAVDVPETPEAAE